MGKSYTSLILYAVETKTFIPVHADSIPVTVEWASIREVYAKVIDVRTLNSHLSLHSVYWNFDLHFLLAPSTSILLVIGFEFNSLTCALEVRIGGNMGLLAYSRSKAGRDVGIYGR